MPSTLLLLGKTRARRERALPLSPLEDLDSWERVLFLRDPGAPGIGLQPRERPLEVFFGELWASPGRSELSERACALIADRLLQRNRGWRWLSALRGGGAAGFAGAALARLHAQHVEAGRPALSGFPHAGELVEALAALDGSLRARPDRLPRALALEALRRDLERPSDWIDARLAPFQLAVIDEPLQLSPLRRALLLALIRRWKASGTHVVVTFESGRELGGAEASAFFEYGDLDEVAFSLRPFAASRALRRELFGRLVATGEAAIHVALADRVLRADPGGAPSAPAAEAASSPEDLSDRIYDRRPLPGDPTDWLGDTIRITACEDTWSEARAAAAAARAALDDGLAPEECAVAAAGLRELAPTLQAAFDDAGVPLALPAGMSLIRSPVARALVTISRLALEDLPPRALLALMGSRLVAVDPIIKPRQIMDWCAAAGVTGGAPATWGPRIIAWLDRRYGMWGERREQEIAQRLAALETACAPLAPLAADQTPSDWRNSLLAAARAWQLPAQIARADLAADPNAATSDAVARARDANVRAWGACLRAIDQLVDDLMAASEGDWPARALSEQLERALRAARWRPEPSASGVRAVEAADLRGPLPRRVWVLGLSRGAFPAFPPTSALTPPEIQRRLEARDPLADARYRLCSWLRNALNDPSVEALHLSWPRLRGGRPAQPASVLQDLLDIPIEGGAIVGGPIERSALGPGREGGLLRDAILSLPDERAVVGRADRLRAAAADPARWLPALPPATRGWIARQRLAIDARRVDRFGAFDGALDTPPRLPSQIGVTAMETYLKCPARYWFHYELAVRPREEWAPELDPARRGTAIHQILQEFIEEREFAPLEGIAADRAAAEHLMRVAERVLDALEADGGFAPALLRYARSRWTAGLLDERPAGVLRAWLDREITGGHALTPVAVESSFDDLPLGPVALRGQLDRLDRLPNGGFLVSDYKTGAPPDVELVRRGMALQPVAYTEAVAREHPGAPLAATWYALKDPDQVGYRGWCGDPILLERLVPRRDWRDGAASDVLIMGPGERARLLAHAARGAERIGRGRFHTTLADAAEAGCRRCEYQRICRVDPLRNARVGRGEGDLQRPLDGSDRGGSR